MSLYDFDNYIPSEIERIRREEQLGDPDCVTCPRCHLTHPEHACNYQKATDALDCYEENRSFWRDAFSRLWK